jgi:hypothetical protein
LTARAGVLVVAQFGPDDDIIVKRFTTAGAVDTTFGGGDGQVGLGDLGEFASSPVAPVLVGDDGKITGVAALDFLTPNLMLFRLNADGTFRYFVR